MSSSAHGHRFWTSGDTEVLIHLYAEHGDAFRRAAARDVRLRALGLPSGADWCWRATATGSSRSTTATPADELEFASELRALPRGEIDLDALEAFLAFNSVPGPLTIFRDVRKLPPGHVLTWEDGTDRAAPLRATGSRSGGRGAPRRGGGARRGAAGATARLGSRAPRVGRPGRGAPLGRDRLVGARGARSGGGCPSRCAPSRSASRSGASTSWPTPGSWPSATAPITTSSCSGPTRRCCFPRSPRPSTSRSRTPRRSRPTSSRSSQPRT